MTRASSLRRTAAAILAAGALLAPPLAGHAEDALVSYKSLAPEIALDLAKAALDSCRARGYQVAVVVVDRAGQPQVVLRDRYAGAHTVPTATGKAWTAASFRTSTRELVAAAQPGQPQAGLRNLPNVVLIAGGLTVEAGGALVGAVGVSGAPGGDEDEACAHAGIEAVRERLEF